MQVYCYTAHTVYGLHLFILCFCLSLYYSSLDPSMWLLLLYWFWKHIPGCDGTHLVPWCSWGHGNIFQVFKIMHSAKVTLPGCTDPGSCQIPSRFKANLEDLSTASTVDFDGFPAPMMSWMCPSKLLHCALMETPSNLSSGALLTILGTWAHLHLPCCPPREHCFSS